jgi:hypothetical protein
MASRSLRLGSIGCQPVLFGSLPKSLPRSLFKDVSGRLPDTTGQRPVLLGTARLHQSEFDFAFGEKAVLRA